MFKVRVRILSLEDMKLKEYIVSTQQF